MSAANANRAGAPPRGGSEKVRASLASAGVPTVYAYKLPGCSGAMTAEYSAPLHPPSPAV